MLLVSLAPGSVVRAADQTPAQIADQELPSLLAIYKDVHSHPELSTQEKRTSEMVAKELKAAGCEVTDHIGKYDQPGLTGYGIVGVMKNGDGPVVLVRTDMDALPVEEETGLPYASKVMAKNNAGEEVHVMSSRAQSRDPVAKRAGSITGSLDVARDDRAGSLFIEFPEKISRRAGRSGPVAADRLAPPART